MIKKILLVGVIAFATSLSAYAQDLPKFEFAVTYNVFIADVDALNNETMHGYGLAFQANVNSYFALVAEWTAAHGASGPVTVIGPPTSVIPEVDLRSYTFLGGPRLTYRKGRANLFTHFLVGMANNKIEDEATGFRTGNGEFAMGLGGGVDIFLGKKISVRAIQFDYIPVHSDTQARLVGDGGGTASASGSSGWFHNTRLQFGLVFLLGER